MARVKSQHGSVIRLRDWRGNASGVSTRRGCDASQRTRTENRDSRGKLHRVDGNARDKDCGRKMRMDLRMTKRLYFMLVALACSSAMATTCQAQLTDPGVSPASGTRVSTLEEQLINRLRATTEDRKAYIRLIGVLIADGRLEQRMVVGIERYALRKNPQFPFPYFERAMRFEAEKRGIELPPVQLLAGSASTYQQSYAD